MPGPHPQYANRRVQFYVPILRTLRELGGSGRPREVTASVLEQVELPAEELARTRRNGGSAVENEIHWARNDLKDFGLIDPSVTGVWTLTAAGLLIPLELDVIAARTGRRLISNTPERGVQANLQIEETPSELPEDQAGLGDLLSVLKGLSPQGFERLSQRLLREAGFSEVHVTGKTGDGGIDGHGVLQVNELVSFRVLFQCKRHKDSVGPSYIRDFRGAMQGRTDKGIFITTGTFTPEAEKEAVREGAPPLELVDGHRLVKLMERLALGVKPRTVYDVDIQFFEQYQ